MNWPWPPALDAHHLRRFHGFSMTNVCRVRSRLRRWRPGVVRGRDAGDTIIADFSEACTTLVRVEWSVAAIRVMWHCGSLVAA